MRALRNSSSPSGLKTQRFRRSLPDIGVVRQLLQTFHTHRPGGAGNQYLLYIHHILNFPGLSKQAEINNYDDTKYDAVYAENLEIMLPDVAEQHADCEY